MRPEAHSKAGIAWPEILFLLSIVMLAASVAVPALLVGQTMKRRAQAYSEMRVLFTAAQQMNKEYRIWPSYRAPDRGDVQYGTKIPNRFVMTILQAVDAEGNAGHSANPLRMDFVAMATDDPEPLRFNGDGDVVDPWGTPYQFVFDTNYDNICTIPSITQGSVLGAGLVVWSCGPDRISDTEDDLRSWKP